MDCGSECGVDCDGRLFNTLMKDKIERIQRKYETGSKKIFKIWEKII